MSILETPGVGLTKPVAQTVRKNRSAQPEKAEAAANVDKNDVVAPETTLKNADEALGYTKMITGEMLSDPGKASVTHIADYRLMDVIRSAR